MMTRISIMWKKTGEVNVTTFEIVREKDLLSDIRSQNLKHPILGDVYWRDDIFDKDVFFAHRKVRNAFDSLGDSVGTAYVVRS